MHNKEHIPGSPYNSVDYYPPGQADFRFQHLKEWTNVASIPPALTKYYEVGGIEVIDYIKAKLTPEQYKGYILGNIYKYSGRLQYKGEEAKDIKKLVEYTNWLKEHNANHA